MEKADKRADALDALRGLAILLMILSGTIPFGNALPAWMYHAQVPPPNHIFNPNLPGITWVDLVFPFFLFAMGAAFPFALSKKIAFGISKTKIIFQIIGRGLLLAGFAIYIQHVKPFSFSMEPTAGEWLIGLLGFALLFPILLRLPKSVKPAVRYAVKAGGIAAAVILLSLLRFPNGSGFSVGRSDIIILVLANVAVFGSLIWLFTRDNVILRLGVLGILIALRLTQNIDGSWNQWLWNFSPFPWLYKLYYLQYLFIVIPGTIAGDLIYRWLKDNESDENAEKADSNIRMVYAAVLMFGFVLVNLIGLFSRHLVFTAAADGLFCIAGFLFLREPLNSTGRLYRSLYNWGAYWLILGIFFEAFEGGIKKDHPTMSYYFVTTGLAIFTYIGLSVFIDYFKKKKAFKLLIDNGQNPMIAYIGGSNLILPLLSLTTLDSLLAYMTFNPWLGFLKGVIVTLLVALATSFFTRKKLFWRT